MSDEKLAAARMSDAMGKLQDALSRLKLAAEELAIVDASLIGSDAHRRLIVESRPLDGPAQVKAAILAALMAADVAKCINAWLGRSQAEQAKQQKEQMERLDREIQDALRGDK